MKSAKHIRAALSILVLVGLVGAWTGQIAHLLLVPHHYCSSHDTISHESEHAVEHEGTLWEVADSHGDDHCSILGNFLRSGTLSPQVAVAEKILIHTGEINELISFSLFTPDLFLLAPKNSPPQA